MQIHFLGGATTVTGSQYLLETARARVLIDCGMFQGSPNESIRNRIPFAYDPSELDTVLLTHAHLDHCGLLPLLVKDGYRGPIHATAGTIELAGLVLLDSGQAARGVRQARGALGEAAPGQGRRRRPARGRPVRGRRRACGRGRGRRRARPDDHRARLDARRLAARPGGRAPRPATEARHRPRRPALHRQGRRAVARPVQPRALRRGGRGRSGRPRDLLRCRPHPRLRDHPAARPGDRRRRRAGDRLLGRPRPARDADPARPDGHDRRRLRPGRVDLRRSRARAGGRVDPGPGRDGPAGRRGGRRPARPVVRDRADPGGRLGAGPAHRAGRDPAPSALPRFADGVEGIRHLPPPSRLLRRGDRQAAARRRHARSTTRTRS